MGGETVGLEFFALKRVDSAQQEYLAACPRGPLAVETVPLARARGRVTAASVHSPAELPAFHRSTVDGFAVRAEDTFGASEGLPAYLRVVDDIPMGRAPARAIGPGECSRIATGGMLPDGADAVVMVEHTESLAEDEVGVLRPASPGQNVMRRGEDCPAGGELLPAGRILRPQELGLLAHAGILSVAVARRPRVALLVTGDELVPPDRTPGPGQIRESNSYTIRALIEESGAEPVDLGWAPDQREAIAARLREGLAHDLLLVTGGSSVGTRDLTAELIAGLGEPGILVHGVHLKPGKPTILALVRPGAGSDPAGPRPPVPVIGLPGHPVSAQVVFTLFVAPLLRQLQGLPAFPAHRAAVRARLSKNYASAPGRLDVLRVMLTERDGELWAEPVQGKSGLISTLTRADGAVLVPEGTEGLLAGAWVDVWLM